jgi:hypothetical protein
MRFGDVGGYPDFCRLSYSDVSQTTGLKALEN